MSQNKNPIRYTYFFEVSLERNDLKDAWDYDQQEMAKSLRQQVADLYGRGVAWNISQVKTTRREEEIYDYERDRESELFLA